MWNDLNKSICVEKSSKSGDDKARASGNRETTVYPAVTSAPAIFKSTEKNKVFKHAALVGTFAVRHDAHTVDNGKVSRSLVIYIHFLSVFSRCLANSSLGGGFLDVVSKILTDESKTNKCTAQTFPLDNGFFCVYLNRMDYAWTLNTNYF